MKAGKYYIGDPCYVLDEPKYDWHKVLKDTLYFGLFSSPLAMKRDMYKPRDEQHGEFPIEDNDGNLYTAAVSTTKYGDGSYYDEEGNEYGVDAGMIGAIPIEAISEESVLNRYCGGKFADGTESFEAVLNRLGHVHEFDQDFSIAYDDGKIRFGTYYGSDVVVDTDPEYDEEDEDEYCYYCGELAEDCVCGDEDNN